MLQILSTSPDKQDCNTVHFFMPDRHLRSLCLQHCAPPTCLRSHSVQCTHS